MKALNLVPVRKPKGKAEKKKKKDVRFDSGSEGETDLEDYDSVEEKLGRLDTN